MENVRKYILVDFDNLSNKQKSFGIYSVLHRITESLAQHCTKTTPYFFNFRLYGGWYAKGNLTRRAQELVSDIHKGRMTALSVPMSCGEHFKPKFRVELAYALGVYPNKHLFATLRKRHGYQKLRCQIFENSKCSGKDCPLQSINNCLAEGLCSGENQGGRFCDIVFRYEQKLVDTMIVSDMIYFSHVCRDEVCIVSSDDDMWPGIISSVSLGGKIIHLKTQRTESVYHFPNLLNEENYKKLILSC